MSEPIFGLCSGCQFQRVVRTTRGSSFSLCELSRENPLYPRYPKMPVGACAGYAPRPADESASSTDSQA